MCMWTFAKRTQISLTPHYTEKNNHGSYLQTPIVKVL